MLVNNPDLSTDILSWAPNPCVQVHVSFSWKAPQKSQTCYFRNQTYDLSPQIHSSVFPVSLSDATFYPIQIWNLGVFLDHFFFSFSSISSQKLNLVSLCLWYPFHIPANFFLLITFSQVATQNFPDSVGKMNHSFLYVSLWNQNLSFS